MLNIGKKYIFMDQIIFICIEYVNNVKNSVDLQ